MQIELRERTASHVRIYFERTGDSEILKRMPRKAQTVEEALEDFHRSMSPESASYGRTIYADGEYVGDVWCYAIHEDEEPDAMISYCIFDKGSWGKGIMSRALGIFIEEAAVKFALRTIGAFTYADNIPSIKVLETNGFSLAEEFMEDGVRSGYYQLEIAGR